MILVSVFVSFKTDTVFRQSESENIYCEQEKTLVQVPLARKSATHRAQLEHVLVFDIMSIIKVF